MKIKLITVMLVIMIASCVSDSDKPASENFAPVKVGSKWVYSYNQRVNDLFTSAVDSGFLTIEITSMSKSKDSSVYQGTVVDSAYFHKFTSNLQPERNSDVPYVDTFGLSISETRSESLAVKTNSNHLGHVQMIEAAFFVKEYPESSIVVEEYQSRMRDVVKASFGTMYVRGIGLVKFHTSMVNHPSAEWNYTLEFKN